MTLARPAFDGLVPFTPDGITRPSFNPELFDSGNVESGMTLIYDNDWTQETGGSVDLNTVGATYTDRFGVTWDVTSAGVGLAAWTITPALGVHGDAPASGTSPTGNLATTLAAIITAVGASPAYNKLDRFWFVTHWDNWVGGGSFSQVSTQVLIDGTPTFVAARRDKGYGGGADGVLVEQVDSTPAYSASGITASVLSDFWFGMEVAGANFCLGYSATEPVLPPSSQASLRPLDRLWLPPKPFDSATGDIGSWTAHRMLHRWNTFTFGGISADLKRTRVYRFQG